MIPKVSKDLCCQSDEDEETGAKGVVKNTSQYPTTKGGKSGRNC